MMVVVVFGMLLNSFKREKCMSVHLMR